MKRIICYLVNLYCRWVPGVNPLLLTMKLPDWIEVNVLDSNGTNGWFRVRK